MSRQVMRKQREHAVASGLDSVSAAWDCRDAAERQAGWAAAGR